MRGVVRSLRRIRFLRGALLVIAVLLLGAVSWEIWSHRPRRKPSQAPPPAAQPDNATQTLDKFEYTATAMGKLAYRILADKLTGVEGGLHTLQGIKRAEFKLADGRTLTASADHGTFMSEPPAAAGNGKGGAGASGATGASGGTESGGTGTNGNSRGHGHVVLEGHVVVTSDMGERLESDRVEYSQAEATLVSPGKCRFRLVPPPETRGGPGPSEGEAGSVSYELNTKIIGMKDGVVIHMSSQGSPGILATGASARFAADGTTALIEGDARIERGEEFLAAPRIDMVRSEDGDHTHLVASPGAKGSILPGSALTPTATAPARGAQAPRPTLVAARTIEATDVASTGERRVTLSGDASLAEAAVPGLPPGRTLRARSIDLREAARAAGAAPGASTPRTLHAEGGVRATLPPGPGETVPRILTSARLDALTAPDGSLATADADGTVTLQSGNRRSVSARARMIGQTRVELRGARPVVEEPEHRIVADEIDYVTKPSELTARGSVQTRFVPSPRAGAKTDRAADPGASAVPGARAGSKSEAIPGAPPEKAGSPAVKDTGSGGLPFTPGVPVDVLSDTAVMKEDAKTAEFTGHVRARQTDRALSAGHLIVDDSDKTARADGSVVVRSFREESAPAAATTPATATSTSPAGTGPDVPARSPASPANAAIPAAPPPPAGGASKPSGAIVKIPVQVNADTLLHDDVRKLTRFGGHAVYREPGRLLTADAITLEGGSGGTPQTTRAEGHVVYDGEGKRGTGDLALHQSDAKSVTLEGHERPAQVLEAASGRSWRGPSLTWVQAPDSIPVVTGTSGRSRIVGSISSQQRDDVGKPADRGKPR